MTTPRDLMFVAMDVESSRTLERGNLSLALAGAELIDLLEAQAISLDVDRIVPGYRPAVADRLMDEAASSLDQQPPYESVEDWLWRRGRGLSKAYLTAFEAEGQLTRQPRSRWIPFRSGGRMTLADTPARRGAASRWTAGEPVLAGLAATLKIRGEWTEEPANVDDAAVETVLGTVTDAVNELEFERQRRAIDEEAFSNIWRGPGG